MIIVKRKGKPITRYCPSETMEIAIDEILKTVCEPQNRTECDGDPLRFVIDIMNELPDDSDDEEEEN